MKTSNGLEYIEVQAGAGGHTAANETLIFHEKGVDENERMCDV